MILHLRVENMDVMPDGGPIEIRAESRSLEIGRHTFLDWTLADPAQYISGTHCRIDFTGDGFMLHDLSRNGTFLNGAEARMKAPHRLQSGDRFLIGTYLIRATVEDGAAADPWREITQFLAKDRKKAPKALSPNIWDLPEDTPQDPAGDDEMLLTDGRAPADRVADASAAEMLRAFAAGAGIAPETIAGSDPLRFAEGTGRLLRQVCERLMMLLAARATACRAMASPSVTMLSRAGNNPLKSLSDPGEALTKMLGPRQEAWLGAEEALVQGLHDVMDHELRLFQAIQTALLDLARQLAPDAVEAANPDAGGLLTSRAGQLWEAYAAHYRTFAGASGEALHQNVMESLGRAYRGQDRTPRD